MNPLPSRPTIAERLAAIDALLNQFDAALAEAARASAAIRAILAGEPRPPRYLTLEEAARHVAARLGATDDGDDDDGPLFDGSVTTKAELDEAYARAGSAGEVVDATIHEEWCDGGHDDASPCPPADSPCMMADCGHEESEHALALDTGDRLYCGADGCKCRRYLSAQAMRIAPGESAGPATLASVQVQADGSVTAERPPTGYVAIPQEELRGARIGGQQ